MRNYRDDEKRDWPVSITVAALKRVQANTGANLLDILDAKGEMFARLHDDPMFLVDVLWSVVQPNAETRGVSPEQFAESLAGDVLDRATTALLEALADFFRRPQQRAAFRALLEKADRVQEMVEKASLNRIEALDPAALAAKLSGFASSSPESSESTPTR